MNRFKMAFLFLSIFTILSCHQEKKLKVIAVVLAHPDDETAVGQILAKYAREQKKVYLILACDGRYGVEEHAKIPAGDTLVQVRKKESICGCTKLGIQPPIFLNLHDGMGIVDGIGQYFDQTIVLKEKLKKQIAQLNPDAIITFGPDGDTGHPDHRGISDITTEVILSEGWYEKYPLYYIGWLKEKVVAIPQGQMTSLNYVDKEYLNVSINYTETDRQKLFESLNCYKSQFTEADIKKWIDAELKDSSFTFYFRRFVTDTNKKNSF